MVQSDSAKDCAMKAVKERLNLYLTKPVMDDLRRLVPARERTQFVEEILARELRRRRLKEALKASAGAWKDEDHPDMLTGKDIDRWIEEQRQAGTARRDELDKMWGQDE
jgi:hypothetical protein